MRSAGTLNSVAACGVVLAAAVLAGAVVAGVALAGAVVAWSCWRRAGAPRKNSAGTIRKGFNIVSLLYNDWGKSRHHCTPGEGEWNRKIAGWPGYQRNWTITG